ncbi:hypothetical protein BpHYR1_015951 [Brachionus plicatilis]|uniref:Uncharacterized protein n=1 Tax=Brachionus plicatilis TaxID=10195 RepID=A0A3M7T014_BRAPC|nr:hypothetical protein BpHYR1_015951 [Brachionus plicatilis]
MLLNQICDQKLSNHFFHLSHSNVLKNSTIEGVIYSKGCKKNVNHMSGGVGKNCEIDESNIPKV